MKSLAANNPHLQTASVRKAAVERNVRSSSAIEGVSATVFRSAATGRSVNVSKSASGSTVVNDRRPKKK